MPIVTSNLLEWADIQAIYTNLNRAKYNFGQTQIPVPNAKDNIVLTSHLSTLVSQIQAMSSVPKIGVNANVGVTIPSPGDIIYPFEFSKAATVAKTISEICNFNSHNAAFDSSYNNHDSFDSFDDHDSFDGYNSNNNHDSYNDNDANKSNNSNNNNDGFDDYDRNISRGSDY